MGYTDEEIMAAAREVSELTGVPESLLRCTTPDNMPALADTVIQHAESQAPKVHAAPSTKRSRIVRGNDYRPSNGQTFAELVRDRMHWA